MSTKIVKLSSREAGPWTRNLNHVSFKIDSDGFTDYSESYLLLKTAVSPVDTTGAAVRPVYIGSDEKSFPGAVMIKNSKYSADRVGDIEEIRGVNVLRKNLSEFTLDNAEQRSRAYDSYGSELEYKNRNVRNSVFLDRKIEGTTASSMKEIEVRIPLKDILGTGYINEFPNMLVGNSTLSLELEDIRQFLASPQEWAGNADVDQLCADQAADAADRTIPLVLDETYAWSERIPFKEGDYVRVQYDQGVIAAGSKTHWGKVQKISRDQATDEVSLLVYPQVVLPATATMANVNVANWRSVISLPHPNASGGAEDIITLDINGQYSIPGINPGAPPVAVDDTYKHQVPLFVGQRVRVLGQHTNAAGSDPVVVDVTTLIAGINVRPLTGVAANDENNVVITFANNIVAGLADTRILDKLDITDLALVGAPNALDWEISECQLVLYKLMSADLMKNMRESLKKGQNIQFDTYKTEVTNIPQTSNYDRQFDLEPNCSNVYFLAPSQADNFESIYDNVDEYRNRLDGEYTSSERVAVESPLYYDKIIKSLDADGEDARNFDHTNFLIGEAIPKLPVQRMLQLSLRSAVGVIAPKNLYVFKTVEKELKATENGVMLI